MMAMTAFNKQALREAAEKATGAHDRLSVMPADDIFDISLHEGTQLDADITDLNAFSEAANPAAVLALLDELEAAENRMAELEAREIKQAKGEVLVVVSGFTGCGKSAIAGEIEIAMKAIGVPVRWTNGDAESA